jgi:hypothetical protein
MSSFRSRSRSRTRAPKKSRGQTLVLFALSLMLLTLMVMMTLAIGTRAKEKMEQQAVADQAAYSQAVATARTFNSLAMLQRTQIALMIAYSGVQSAMSFAGSYRGYLNGIQLALIGEAFNQGIRCFIPPFCGCPGAAGVAASSLRVQAEHLRVAGIWTRLDGAAARQAQGLHGAARMLYLFQLDVFWRSLFTQALVDQKLVREVVQKASKDPEWDAPKDNGEITDVTVRETGVPLIFAVFQLDAQKIDALGDVITGAFEQTMDNVEQAIGNDTPDTADPDQPDYPEALDNVLPRGALLPISKKFNTHAVWAAMGSRGNAFNLIRLGMQLPLSLRLRQVMVPDQVLIPVHLGEGLWGATESPGGPLNTTDAAGWGVDDGGGIYRYSGPGCPGLPLPLVVSAHIKSTDRTENSDAHVWNPPTGIPEPNPRIHSTRNRCVGNGALSLCPSMWPKFMDYNFTRVAMERDNFGQPKNYAVVQRDYSKRAVADPWNPMFKFQFASGSGGTDVDYRGVKLKAGTDISKATTVSTGIAYYHRGDHWREPPNIFNPYWRAGLSRMDADFQFDDDIKDTLDDALVPWAREAYEELHKQGYRGYH